MLRQGSASVSDYVIRFCTLAAESRWNSMALYDVFLKGLAVPIQEQLIPVILPSDLDSLISLAIRMDNRLRELKASRSGGSTSGGRSSHAVGQDLTDAGGTTAPTAGGPLLLLRPDGSPSGSLSC